MHPINNKDIPIQRLILVGAFPPPVHGLSLINEAMKTHFQTVIPNPTVFDLSSSSLKRKPNVIFVRFIRFVASFLRFLITISFNKPTTLYIGFSGGFGQVYDFLFLIFGKMCGYNLFVHHHSFSYIHKKKLITSIFFRLLGSNIIHIVLCKKMEHELLRLYNVTGQIYRLSNTAALDVIEPDQYNWNQSIKRIGFFGNISFDKGIDTFFAVLEQLSDHDIQVRGIIAGQIQDKSTKLYLTEMVKKMDSVEYLGSKFGQAKSEYFKSIDVLLMPSKQKEAEPIVIHEAMAHGVPVIAQSMGCIPELIIQDTGLVIEESENYISASYHQIQKWINTPAEFQMIRKNAANMYKKHKSDYQSNLVQIVNQITHSRSGPVNQIKSQKTADKKNLNILHVTPAFYPATHYGGPVHVIYELAKRQIKLGHQVFVITSNIYVEEKLKADQIHIIDGINVLYLSYRNFWKNLLGVHIIITPKLKAFARQIFSQNKFDIVHIHELRNYLSPFISKLCNKNDIPYVITPHGTLHTRGESVLKKSLFDQLYGKQILHNSSSITVLTPQEKRELQALYDIDESKYYLLPNGIDLEKYSYSPTTNNFKSQLGINSDDRIILYLGRLHRNKGLDLLLHAFSLVSQKNLYLVIAGTPEGGNFKYQTQLDILAKKLGIDKQVKFTGFLEGDNKLNAYRSSELFVLPSKYESFGLVILEAMACQCPVLTTNVVALSDMLESNQAAIVTKHSSIDIANNIKLLLSDSLLRKRTIENANKFIKQFSWDQCVEKLDQLYRMNISE